MKNKKNSTKKPLYKKWWFWVIVVILLAGLGGNDSEGDVTSQDTVPTGKTTETSVVIATESEITEPSIIVHEVYSLIGGELGEFGFEVILNEGSEFPDKRYEYSLPSGIYEVTNESTEYLKQLDIVLPDVVVTSDGIEEQNYISSTMFQPNETKEITIEDGQVIEIELDEEWTFVKIG